MGSMGVVKCLIGLESGKRAVNPFISFSQKTPFLIRFCVACLMYGLCMDCLGYENIFYDLKVQYII